MGFAEGERHHDHAEHDTISAATAYISPPTLRVAAFNALHQRAAVGVVHLAVHIDEKVRHGAAAR